MMTGGLISAALLAVPGASAYFLGGAVVYTRQAKNSLLAISDGALSEFRPATEQHAVLLARRVRVQFAATWGLGETGATGPSGNCYGDPAGHTCLAIAGGRAGGYPGNGQFGPPRQYARVRRRGPRTAFRQPATLTDDVYQAEAAELDVVDQFHER